MHEVKEDAPFVGAIIIAPYCYFECKGCHNQHLLQTLIQKNTVDELLDKVQENKFNEGIILSGLEWTATYEAMYALIEEAIARELKVMVYTGLSEKQFASRFWEVLELPIMVKYGKYDESQIKERESYGVKLATANQYIKDYGENHKDKNGKDVV
ncbi:MAG: 4Fe-4S cluster-binding domain-containing protein [Bacteroidales bacterium]|nr:4Fe-4S cluster-binding domain-containing protein [Bacteroidales bacterium]